MKWSTFRWRLRDIWREPWADTKALVRCFLGRHEEGTPGRTMGIWCKHCHTHLRFDW